MSSALILGSEVRRRYLPSRCSSAFAFPASTRSSPPGVNRRYRFRPGFVEMTPRSSALLSLPSLSVPSMSSLSWVIRRARAVASRSAPSGLQPMTNRSSSAMRTSLTRRLPTATCPRCGWSGCLVAGLGEREPLVAEVGDDLQAAAEGFDVGGQGPQFGRAGLGVLDRGDAALGDTHARGHLRLGDAQPPAHLRQAPGALLGAQLLHPGCDRGLVRRIGVELTEELLAGVMVKLGTAHRMPSCF